MSHRNHLLVLLVSTALAAASTTVAALRTVDQLCVGTSEWVRCEPGEDGWVLPARFVAVIAVGIVVGTLARLTLIRRAGRRS
jgi:hypothetical protein